MNTARVDEAQAGIKIAGRDINNLRYADDPTLMGESGLPVLFLRHLFLSLPAILIPACVSSSPAFLMMYYA